MIITVTPNIGIDYTLQVSDFQLDKTIRSTGSAWGMGGKATDVSWILGKLGIPSRALGFAAGPNGVRMENMLRERGVETDFVQVGGEMRLNTIIVVPGRGQSTITSSSLSVSPDHLSEFSARYQKALEVASCVVMGGSLPNGVPIEFYEKALTLAGARQDPVIFDSSRPPLVAGLKCHPDLIKPNLTELADLLDYLPASRDEVLLAARKLQEEFGSHVIVTLGAEGAIVVFGEASYFIHPVTIPVVSSAGAGDGVLAGMAIAYLRNENLEYGLQHGFALAGAVMETLATADIWVEEYQKLLSQVRITPL